jgi:hypothetical protein
MAAGQRFGAGTASLGHGAIYPRLAGGPARTAARRAGRLEAVPALSPITMMVWPSSCGSRCATETVVAVSMDSSVRVSK